MPHPTIERIARADTLVPNVALVFVCLFWGSTYGATSALLDTLPPAVLMTLRFGLAGVGFLLFALARGERLPRDPRAWLDAFVVSFSVLFLGYLLSVYALLVVPSGLASVLLAVMPFFFIGMCAMAGEKAPGRVWLAVAVTCGGVILTVVPDLAAPRLEANSGPFLLGSLTLIAVAVFWSYGSYYVRRQPERMPLATALALQHLMSVPLLAGVGLVRGEWGVAAYTGDGWLLLAWLIAAGSWGGYGLYIYILPRLPAARSSINAYGSPVIALVVGWVFLGERLSAWQWVGCAVVLSGVALVSAVTADADPVLVDTEAVEAGQPGQAA